MSTSREGLLGTSDPASDLTFTVQTAPTHGTLTVLDGLVRYNPDTSYVGRDAATVQACRTATPTDCDTSAVTVEVLPIAADDEADLVAGGGAVVDVRANDRGDVGLPQVVQAPMHGTASVNAAGDLVYLPSGSFTGHDLLTYQICAPAPDDDLCAEATVHLRVYPVASRRPVRDLRDRRRSPSTSGPTTRVTPAHRRWSSHRSTVRRGRGTAGRPPSGRRAVRWSTRLTGTFTGYDTFVYQICSTSSIGAPRDGTPLCARAAVTVAVQPLTRPDRATTQQETPSRHPGGVNDIGDAGPPLLPSRAEPRRASSTAIGAAPSFGTAEVLADGTVRYTPRAGFTGTDSFTYVRCSVNAPALCSVAEVSILVLPAVTPTPTPTPTPTDGGGGGTPTSGGGGSTPSTGGSASGLPRTGGIALGAALLGLLLVGFGTAARRAGRREHRH